jgi:hypothetical protein
MQMTAHYDPHQKAEVRTTLNIDEAPLSGAMKAAPGLTKTAVINEALREHARAALCVSSSSIGGGLAGRETSTTSGPPAGKPRSSTAAVEGGTVVSS